MKLSFMIAHGMMWPLWPGAALQRCLRQLRRGRTERSPNSDEKPFAAVLVTVTTIESPPLSELLGNAVAGLIKTDWEELRFMSKLACAAPCACAQPASSSPAPASAAESAAD